MTFMIGVLVTWIIAVALVRKYGKLTRWFDAFTVLTLFSIIMTIDLGINYLASSIPEMNDGIGIHGVFAPWIIDDERWSVDLFKMFYSNSVVISAGLTIITAATKAIEK